MRYIYDPLVDALLITFRKGKVAETREVTPFMNIDVDKDGKVLSIEVFDASKQINKQEISHPGFSVTPYSKKKIRELVIK